MAVDLSKGVTELFSGRKRIGIGPTLAITMIVTALVAIPLIYRAIDARDDPPPVVVGDSGLVLVMMGDEEPRPLDQTTVSGPIMVSVNDPEASAVSFNLFPAGRDDVLVASQDLEGPDFDLVIDDSGQGEALDSTLLEDGEYELFVTVRTDENDQRTAVAFQVNNS